MKRRSLLLLMGGTLWAGQVDVVAGKLQFQVAPPDPYLRAQVVWHLTGQTEPLMQWDLGAGLRLTQVESSWGIDTFWHDTLARKVWLRFRNVPQGELGWVRVAYEGIPRSSGFGSYEVRAHATGWCLWTLSQPYGAPDWLFCRDGLADKVDSLTIVVRTPPDYLGVANGRLLADSLASDGWRYRHFRHQYPIAVYLIAVAVSNYVVQEFPVETPYHRFVLRNYVYPQDTARARALAERFLPYFQWIEARLGPYPFAMEDYQQVQIGWPGGMEHQTITFFGSYSLELWAHELAHQWFGDWVTCGSWQDIWLNEAFATLLGGAVYEALGEAYWWERWRHLTVLGAWRDTLHAIWVEDTTDFQRIFSYPTTYAKGAMALQGLREYIGEEKFWAGLRVYLSRYGGGFARTEDFGQAVQSVWGLAETEAFIQGWIFLPGYPRLTLSWRSGGGFSFQLNRPYPLRVPWIGIEGTDTVQGTFTLMGSDEVPLLQSLERLYLDPDTLTLLWGARLLQRGSARVWPVPFKQGVWVQLPGLRRLWLYTERGQLAAYLELPTPVPLYYWPLEKLPAGLYLLHAEGEEHHVQRLLRED